MSTTNQKIVCKKGGIRNKEKKAGENAIFDRDGDGYI